MENAKTFPSGTSILQVYEQAQKSLLVLGEPGAGKTHLLLVLARDLLDRAKKDLLSPIPMVFNLSSWSTKHKSLNDWIIKQCKEKYTLREEVTQSWIEGSRISLLLDGFDEVSTTHRTSCIHAINTFHQEYPTISIVVCSRFAEYLALAPQFWLQKAILIEPLTKQQIDQYLAQTDLNLEGVRRALQDDTVLREIATTPLMLDILVRTYHGLSIDEIILSGSLEERRQQIFTTYVQRMLQRRQKDTHYTQEQVVRWLSWLASYLALEWQTDFSFEDLQPAPAFLGDPDKLALYRSRVSLTTRVLFALSAGFIAAAAVHDFFLIGVCSISGWLMGADLVSRAAKRDWYRDWKASIDRSMNLVHKKFNDSELREKSVLREIEPAESINWSWEQVRSSIAISIGRETNNGKRERIIAACYLFIFILLGGATLFGGLELVFAILSIFAWYIFYLGLNHQKKKQPLPARHARGILSASVTGVFVGGLAISITGLILGLFLLQYIWVYNQVKSGWLTDLFFGYGLRHTNVTLPAIYPPLLSLLFLCSLWAIIPHGWFTATQRFFLHLFLRRMDYIPPNYCKFFDYAVERVLLRRSGNGWAFYHRLLQEHFTMQNTEDIISASALFQLARYYNGQEQPEWALILFQQALKRAEQQMPIEDGSNDAKTIRVLCLLADLYYILERYGEAEPLHERILEFLERYHIETPRHYVVMYQAATKLAEIYKKQGKDAKVEPLFERTFRTSHSTKK